MKSDTKSPSADMKSAQQAVPAHTSTSIDLGDDLLEKTALQLQHEPVPESAPEPANEKIHSARILIGEGFIEEAKKILRAIIVADSGNLEARQRLDEIHELELKQIFNGDPAPGSRRAGRNTPKDSGVTDTEAVMRDLDHDLGLGLFKSPHAMVEPGLASDGPGLACDDKDSTPRDSLDLGIAFIEMGLYGLAVRQFQASRKSSEFFLTSTALLSWAMIQDGKPFEATLELETVLEDSELSPAERIEFIYLMGRASESLQRLEPAIQWYRGVRAIDPEYRDATERLRRCESARS